MKLRMINFFKPVCIFLFCVFTTLFADVYSTRYNDESIHQAMPGWVNLKNGNPEKNEPQIQYADFGSKRYTVVDLDYSHQFTYNGVAYSSLSIFDNGMVVFGDVSKENVDPMLEPHVKPLGVSKKLAQGFRWEHFSQDFKKQDGSTVIDYYTVIEFDKFSFEGKEYSIQMLFYSDGEIQTQLWEHGSGQIKIAFEEWMIPSVFNGSKEITYKGTLQKNAYVYGSEGLRPGWISKGLLNYTGFSVMETKPGAGLLVSMGSSQDAGGLIAYDFSREHPVVGSFSSVVVTTENAKSDVSPFSTIPMTKDVCMWYFTETETLEKDTYYADYPKLKTGANRVILKSTDYGVSFGENKDNKEFLRTIAAPAFKFQYDGSKIDAKDYDDKFIIKSVLYNYEQRPSFQFLPQKTKVLTIKTVGNGNVLVNYPEGVSPFNLYEGQKFSAKLVAKPGSEIKSISVNNIFLVKDKDVVDVSDFTEASAGEYRKYFYFTNGEKIETVDINIDHLSENVDIVAEFTDCEKRPLTVKPEIVVTESYLDPVTQENARSFSSATIKNAFGGVAETQELLSNGKYVVNAAYKDALGNDKYNPLPFVVSADDFEYFDKACFDCVVEANKYYDGTDVYDKPKAFGYAYTENDRKYGSNTGSLGVSYGLAEASAAYQNGNAESWEMPATDEDNFILSKYLNATDLAKIYEHRILNPGKYSLTITRDAENRFVQSIKNEKNQVVSEWQYDGKNTVVYKYEYDEKDRLIKKWPTLSQALAVKYAYDGLGRVVSVFDPDRGETRFSYDQFGRTRFVQTDAQRSKSKKTYTAKMYDDQDREFATVEVFDDDYSFDNADAVIDIQKTRVVSEIIFGVISKDELARKIGNSELAEYIVDNTHNVRESDVGAVFAYDEYGKITSVKISSYDRIGRKTHMWIVYGLADMPAVQLTYSYNAANEMITSSFEEWDNGSWINKILRSFTYDNKGRLSHVKEIQNGVEKNMASYEFTPNGHVNSKKYFDGQKSIYEKTLINDVYGRPIKISYENNGEILYQEDISYKSPISAKAAKISHSYNNVVGSGSFARSYYYDYDYMGRLTEVSGSSESEYTYDVLGRMTSKSEGDSKVMFAFGGSSYRPTGFGIKGVNNAPSSTYFEYDKSGNVWMDRHNKTAYKNNDMGMPVKGYKFDDFNSKITLEDLLNDAVSVDDYTGSLEMAYDEGGNRLWYSAELDGQKSYVEATIGGVATYSKIEDGEMSLVRKELIDGGFRGVDGFARFPVTDVQGNIRGYATSDGLISAYDYYPYGTVIDLSKGDDVNRQWQGKEFDGEHGKYYFGARYFDPFFGMWLSPDPANQFANPYTFGGDPINFVDLDGRFILEAASVITVLAMTALSAYMGYEFFEKALQRGFAPAEAFFIGAGVFAVNMGGLLMPTPLTGAIYGAVANVGINMFDNYLQGNGFGSLGENAAYGVVGAVFGAAGGYSGLVKPLGKIARSALAGTINSVTSLGMAHTLQYGGTYFENGAGMNVVSTSYALKGINHSSLASLQMKSNYTDYSIMNSSQRELYMINGDVYECKYGQFIPVDLEKEAIQQNTINQMNILNQNISDMYDFIFQNQYQFEMPENNMPEINVPDVVNPEFNVDIPKFEFPEVTLPF